MIIILSLIPSSPYSVSSKNRFVITKSAVICATRAPIVNEVIDIDKEKYFSFIGNHWAAICWGMLKMNGYAKARRL